MADLYAIVGDLKRAHLMLEAGVPYLQLRFKDTPLEPHSDEIRTWAQRYPDTRVVVNDDLKLAESLDVWGAHLGQEDLDAYDPPDVRASALQIGISTHDAAELERALDLGAAMVGFGPVFATDTKTLKHKPQGIARLREFVYEAPVPVIAIGGIAESNLKVVADTAVPMIAMIAYLDQFNEPAEVQSLMVRMARQGIHGPR